MATDLRTKSQSVCKPIASTTASLPLLRPVCVKEYCGIMCPHLSPRQLRKYIYPPSATAQWYMIPTIYQLLLAVKGWGYNIHIMLQACHTLLNLMIFCAATQYVKQLRNRTWPHPAYIVRSTTIRGSAILIDCNWPFGNSYTLLPIVSVISLLRCRSIPITAISSYRSAHITESCNT